MQEEGDLSPTEGRKEPNHAPGAEILLDVRLRAEGRQSDGQGAYDVQAADRRPQADPRGRWLLRADRRRRTAVLQARERQVPRRGLGDRRARRSPPEEGLTRCLPGSRAPQRRNEPGGDHVILRPQETPDRLRL